MITYKEFRSKIRKRAWAGLEAESLVESHNNFFLTAMGEIAKFIPCYQSNNTTVFEFCSTVVDCAKTVVDKPNGFLRRVYTIANDGWCNRVFYAPSTYDKLMCWTRNMVSGWTAPDQTNLPALPMGARYVVDKSTDSPVGRSRTGIHAIHNRRIYLSPWIQSNESVVVEWDGMKLDWKDTDLIDDEKVWEADVQLLIQMYVTWQHETLYGKDPQQAIKLGVAYNMKFADLMHTCKKKMEAAAGIPCDNDRLATSEEIAAEAVPADAEPLVFANIGDFGNPSLGAEVVANLVKGWDSGDRSFYITTNGDNIYAPAGAYADAVGAFYGDYIKDDPDENRFWPARGNHDYEDPINAIQDFVDYFVALDEKRYYELVKAPVHFFILNTSLESLGAVSPEPDGIEVTSTQAQWLKAKLALSTARWKVVIIHDAPYTNGTDFPGHAVLRWPFKTWGADIVLSGDAHEYERFEVDGLPYIVNGAGGAVLRLSFNASTEENDEFLKFAVYGKYGALKVTPTCDSLTLQFYDTDGVKHDELVLT